MLKQITNSKECLACKIPSCIFLKKYKEYAPYLSDDEKEKLSKFLVLVLIVFYGLGNLVSAFSYQKKLLKFRTKPVKEFYQQLSYILPKIEKGDIFQAYTEERKKGEL